MVQRRRKNDRHRHHGHETHESIEKVEEEKESGYDEEPDDPDEVDEAEWNALQRNFITNGYDYFPWRDMEKKQGRKSGVRCTR